MKKFTTLEIKWGILFIIAGLLWMMYEKMMGWHDEHIDKHAGMTLLFSIPAISVYVFALLEKRKRHYNNIMTWKEGFLCGLMISLVVALLSPLSQLITHQLITPGFFPNMIEYSVNELGRDRAQAEAYFNLKSYIFQSVIGALMMGMVTSAVVAFFVRRKATN